MSTFRPRLTMTAGAMVLSFALGGCQLLGIGGHGRVALENDSAAILKDFGADQLADGRKALVEGRTADAIDAFLIARAFPEQAPAAFNGLAVAYSRLGRTDLAERFFQAAVALAPQDDRYRANLALFYTRNPVPRAAEPAMAMTAPEAIAPPVAIAAAPAVSSPVRTLGGGVTVQAPQVRLQRLSAAEVRIGSPAASPARHQPVIHVGAAQPAAYPIRIILSDIAQSAAPAQGN